MLSTPELIIIFLIIMLVYGGTRLPAMGRGLGQGVREFREGLRGEGRSAAAETSKAARPGSDGTDDASQAGKDSQV